MSIIIQNVYLKLVVYDFILYFKESSEVENLPPEQQLKVRKEFFKTHNLFFIFFICHQIDNCKINFTPHPCHT